MGKEVFDHNDELSNWQAFYEFWGTDPIIENNGLNEKSDPLDDALDKLESNAITSSDHKGDNDWWSRLSEEERKELRQIEDDIANGSYGYRAVKNGKFTLTALLQGILYCDQIMELEEIMDELSKEGWNYDEKIVLMLLARSSLFEGNKKTGFACPSSSRRWISQKHWSQSRRK